MAIRRVLVSFAAENPTPMFELFVTIFAALFSVVNPMGAVPFFLGMTPDYTPQERNHTALMSSIFFVLILLSFFFAGTAILSFFGITINAMRIAGGLIIMSSGYALLQGKFAESRAINKKVREETLAKEDISFSPMAMPMLSGPGSISLLIGMYNEYEGWNEKFMVAGTVVFLGVIIYFILRSSPMLFRVLGVTGLKALSRIMGFLVMAIGIEFIIDGVVNLVASK